MALPSLAKRDKGDFLNNTSSQLWAPYYVGHINLRGVFSEPASTRTQGDVEKQWDEFVTYEDVTLLHSVIVRTNSFFVQA